MTNAEIAMRDDFEERAAIMEYEAGLPRVEAERLARQLAAQRGRQEKK